MKKSMQEVQRVQSYQQVLLNKTGSPTVEYVILIGVGAAVAGLLAVALSSDNNGKIVKTISG